MPPLALWRRSEGVETGQNAKITIFTLIELERCFRKHPMKKIWRRGRERGEEVSNFKIELFRDVNDLICPRIGPISREPHQIRTH